LSIRGTWTLHNNDSSFLDSQYKLGEKKLKI